MIGCRTIRASRRRRCWTSTETSSAAAAAEAARTRGGARAARARLQGRGKSFQRQVARIEFELLRKISVEFPTLKFQTSQNVFSELFESTRERERERPRPRALVWHAHGNRAAAAGGHDDFRLFLRPRK